MYIQTIMKYKKNEKKWRLLEYFPPLNEKYIRL